MKKFFKFLWDAVVLTVSILAAMAMAVYSGIVWVGRRLVHFFRTYDSIWSAPLILLAFVLASRFFMALFGFDFGSYTLDYFPPVIMAVAVVVVITNAATAGMYINAPALYKYLFARKDNEFKNDFNTLSKWQKLSISLAFYFAFITVILVTYISLT